MVSDHRPVVMQLCFPDHVPPQRTWRLDTRLLADEDFISYISMHIDLFLETNCRSETSRGMLWEAMKAYLHGQIISYTISTYRRKTQRMTELMRLISDIDKRHSSQPSADLYQERITLQSE